MKNLPHLASKTLRYASLSFDNRIIWEQSRDALVAVIVSLGFPAELGEMIARHLGSPKGIDRMTAYLQYERPTDDRMIVDEMLAISEEIESWRKKKNSRASNADNYELLSDELS